MKKRRNNRKKKEIEAQKNGSGIYQHEDAVLKTAMQFFADELLPYFGIKGKVVSFAPTELVELELHKLFEDFNLVMEDGSWKHFEFQSTDKGIEDLKRFRVYESLSSYQYKTTVTTYVLCSGKIRHPVTEFTEGLNTYRVHPIIMRDKNADKLIQELRQKQGEKITKQELIPLILSPLMDGESSQLERIKTAYDITGNVTEISRAEIRKIEAVIFAMADKFLENVELEELEASLKMTRLGQMLVNDGIAQGMERGIAQGIERGVENTLINTIKICEGFGNPKDDVIYKIAEMFEKSTEEAKELVEKYWGK